MLIETGRRLMNWRKYSESIDYAFRRLNGAKLVAVDEFEQCFLTSECLTIRGGHSAGELDQHIRKPDWYRRNFTRGLQEPLLYIPTARLGTGLKAVKKAAHDQALTDYKNNQTKLDDIALRIESAIKESGRTNLVKLAWENEYEKLRQEQMIHETRQSFIEFKLSRNSYNLVLSLASLLQFWDDGWPGSRLSTLKTRVLLNNESEHLISLWQAVGCLPDYSALFPNRIIPKGPKSKRPRSFGNQTPEFKPV